MRRNRFLPFALAAAIAFQAPAAWAQECASEVQQAEESARQQYISGMGGLANNSFSNRPGTMSSMACLDKFMKGNMDIFFKPPQLNDLLGQVLNFACQQAKQTIGSAGGGTTNLQGLIGSLTGGMNLGGSSGGGTQLVNLSQVLGGGTNSGGMSQIKSLFSR